MRSIFAQPLYSNVKEITDLRPGFPPKVDSLEQPSGQTVFVRRSSSYYDSLQALNARFAGESRPPVILEAAPEALEDEDLLEMLNAGLIPLIVVDQHKALFWKTGVSKIQVHDNVVLRDGGDIAWAVRKDSSQLLTVLNNFAQKNRQGTTGQYSPAALPENAKYVKNAAARKTTQIPSRW